MANENTPAAAEALDPAASDDSSENARNGAAKRRSPHQPAAVVGIGASAGGIAPLQQFFEGMKADSGLAFVVVMHLSPDFESQLAAVLQQKTTMPVVQVTEAVKVLPDHVYVIPPNHQLTFEDSMLRLLPPQQAQGRRVTIDLFFRTLAHAYGQRAVSIILSGTDSDGVIGLKHIHAQGGVTCAQEPEEAEFDSMPLSAIATGMVDWVLPVADMPGRLSEFVRNENAMQLPPEILDAAGADVKVEDAPGGETVSDETRNPDDEEALALVLKHVRVHTGHDFGHYKRATVLRRIARRLQVNSLESIPLYVEFLREHPAEVRALLQDLLIGVTHFFRDRAAFAALEANVPQLFAGKKRADELRVWIAGCATGEEAYSVAMVLCEHAEKLADPPGIQIFATDIDEQSIQEARDGLYPLTIEADVSPERLRHFFMRDHGRYRVKKHIRDKVLFAAHNVLSDPAFSRLDFVSCRNLLIYLNREAQGRVFDVFHFALRPGGLLLIGTAETADGVNALFSPLDSHHRLYVRRSIPRPTWKIPAIPGRIVTPRRLRDEKSAAPMLPELTTGAVEGAGDQTENSTFQGQERRSVLFGELHLKLLEEYGPPSVVVNDAHDIVHLSENAGRYLSFRAGEPSTNLMTVVNPALRVELRTALFRAGQSNESIIVPAQRVPVQGTLETIDLQVRPIRPGNSAQGFFLVLFQRRLNPLTAEEQNVERETISREVGDELHSLKEQLNATVEQFEASSEELKAQNEELQAMNEELRSAAEELETSKEELQSVNEELITVNQELKDKVEELSRANSDLNNLMTSTDLATIFLDRQLRVLRYTPRVQETFNLLPTDLGRPISDITHKLRYDSLTGDAERVLQRLTVIEREAETPDARTFLARMSPYRTLDDRISGVVLTLIDVTQIKHAQAEVRAGEQRYRTLFELVPVAVYSTDADGVIQDYNKRAVELWGRKPEQGEKFCGSFKIFHPDGRPMPHEECPMARVLHGETLGPEELDILVEQESGTRRNVLVAPRAITDGKGAIVGAINCMHDISARKQIEHALRESEERFRTVADNVPQLIWTNDGEGTANYFNKRWFEYSGLSYEESHGLGWQAIVHPEDEPSSVDRWKRALAKGQVFDAEYRLRGADGEYRWFIGRNVPIGNGDAGVLSWFGTATDINELKEAENALRSTEERFRLLVEGAKDYAMFLLDLDNIITFWSAGAERVFGWSEAEAVGQSGAIIFVPEDIKKNAVEQEIVTAMDEGRAPDRRWHLRKDGTRIWVDGVMTRLEDSDGAPRGFAKIARDATDLREAEDELRHARDEMEQRVIERTQDVLATNTELERTMAQRQQLERELLEISEREKRRIGEDLHDMVCQELTATALFLKSSAKKLGPKSPAAQVLEESAETVNRNVVIARELAGGLQAIELSASGLKNALRDLAAQATSQNAGVSCHFKAARGVRVPDETVGLHLYRVAQEAVNNALKHSEAKNILISLDRNTQNICVSVQDDGKGFVQRRRSKGLGLHMMRYRANALGGELKIERRRSGGMEITCVIPIKR
ncbi:MAG TPA: PAS domain S-box protein [Chthoniobacterales bacterium]|nr:PAS domain S-box protein [Chthoniobacterales bacterium]